MICTYWNKEVESAEMTKWKYISSIFDIFVNIFE